MSLPFKKSAVVILILLVTFFVYRHCLQAGFVTTWDDACLVHESFFVNPFTLQGLHTIFSPDFVRSALNVYSPLTLLSFTVEHVFFGQNPFYYHLDNILLHMAVTGLVFLFALRMGATFTAAACASLLFGIHPMHVESVAWAVERKDVLYAFFYMLSLNGYVNYIRSSEISSYYLSIAWGLLSILAKPMAFSLPLVLLVLDWFFRRFKKGSVRKILTEKIPFLLYMLPLVCLSRQGSDVQTPFNLIQKILVWIWSFVFYFRKLILPEPLLPHYGLPQPVTWNHPAYIGSVCLLVVLMFSIKWYYRRRWFLFAWLFYAVSIVGLLRWENVLNWGNQSVVADRFMYLPSLGFFILFGIWIDRFLQTGLWRQKLIRWVVFVIVCFGLAVHSGVQTQVWNNDIALWSYQISRSPGDPLAYVNRALGYEAAHQYGLAIADDTQAIAIDPGFYFSSVKTDDASAQRIEDINVALHNNPFLVVAHRNRGKLYRKIGRSDLAIRDFNAVLEINPQDAEIYSERLKAYGDLKEDGSGQIVDKI